MTERPEPAARLFRTEESVAAERATRGRVESMLERHGFRIVERTWKEHNTAITQVIVATRGDSTFRLHVRTCWRRDGRNKREHL